MAVTSTSGESTNRARRYAVSCACVIGTLSARRLPAGVGPLRPARRDGARRHVRGSGARRRRVGGRASAVPHRHSRHRRQRAQRLGRAARGTRTPSIGPASLVVVPRRLANSAPNSWLSVSPPSSSTMNSARMRSTSAAASIEVALDELGEEGAGNCFSQLAVIARPVLGGLSHCGAVVVRPPPGPAGARAMPLVNASART